MSNRSGRQVDPVIVGIVVGGGFSFLVILGLPFVLGVCWFLMGPEANPGLVIMILGAFAAVVFLPPVAGFLIGREMKRRRPSRLAGPTGLD
jgi:hypothetical protein